MFFMVINRRIDAVFPKLIAKLIIFHQQHEIKSRHKAFVLYFFHFLTVFRSPTKHNLT